MGWLPRFLRPRDTISSEDVERGMRHLLYDGACSQVMGTFTGGAFLVAFALLLGASNFVIGVLAAAGPLSQVLQVPAIVLVDRTGLRKLLVVVHSWLSRLFLLSVAIVPWWIPESYRVLALFSGLLLYFTLGTVSGCAFNSWMRDFVPEEIQGRYFGKRLAFATAASAGLTLIAILAVVIADWAEMSKKGLYSTLFAVGASAGLLGVTYLMRIPEPRMPRHEPRGLGAVLREPLEEPNFRQLLRFLGWWNFAINLAAPFFAVYMLERLELAMPVVLLLSVASQVVNALFFRIWGTLADRFSNKAVLGVSGLLFVITIAMWPFLTLPDPHAFTIPLLVLIHVMAGISTAGVNLCASTITLKIAPKGRATAYLAMNALVNGVAATLAPILAGLMADALVDQQLTINLRWMARSDGSMLLDLPALDLVGLDFVFLLSALLGLYAMHRLLAVREEGEVRRIAVLGELQGEVRRALRHVSNVAGLRNLYSFPFARLEELIRRRAKPDKPDDEETPRRRGPV
ncbi:MAG: MFS transporter [Planctomycetota bacterium]